MSHLYKIAGSLSLSDFRLHVTELPIDKQTEKTIRLKEGHEDKRVFTKDLDTLIPMNSFDSRFAYKVYTQDKAKIDKYEADLMDVIHADISGMANEVETMRRHFDHVQRS